MWTKFMDMHSGGGTKEPPYEYIYIEASEKESPDIFMRIFGHYPGWVTCHSCGDNYSWDEYPDLEHATAFERQCTWIEGRYDPSTAEISLEDYIKRSDVKIIRKEDIPNE